MSHGFCVATPVGQWSVWQRCAWMQPIASIASRADVDHVAAEREREQRRFGEAELARADEHDLLVHARARRRSS